MGSGIRQSHPCQPWGGPAAAPLSLSFFLPPPLLSRLLPFPSPEEGSGSSSDTCTALPGTTLGVSLQECSLGPFPTYRDVSTRPGLWWDP